MGEETTGQCVRGKSFGTAVGDYPTKHDPERNSGFAGLWTTKTGEPGVSGFLINDEEQLIPFRRKLPGR